MAQTDALKKYLEAGMAFTQLTRSKAEQVVKDLVAAGELQRNQAKSAIDELVERSRKNADLLAEQVRKEVDSQLSRLGLARDADGESSDEPAAEAKPTMKEPAKKEPAKKGPATSAKKSSSAESPVGADLPGRKAAESEGGGDKGETTKKAAPAKSAKKSSSAESPVGVDLPGRKAAESEGDRPAAKKAAKVTKKQG